jgi:hypothetical protein
MPTKYNRKSKKQPALPPEKRTVRKIKRNRRTRNKNTVVKARQKHILDLYAKGNTPEQISTLLDMDITHVKNNINIATDDLIKGYATPSPQQSFIRYATFQMNIINKLQMSLEKITPDPNAPATLNYNINALKTQSEIYDKVLNKGIDFGVIQYRRADPASITAKPKDIRIQLKREITVLSALLDDITDETNFRAIKQETSSTTTTIIRKPLLDKYNNPVQDIPDFRFKKDEFIPIKPPDTHWSEQEYEKHPLPLRNPLIPSLKDEYLKEKTRQRTEITVQNHPNQPIESTVKLSDIPEEKLQQISYLIPPKK